MNLIRPLTRQNPLATALLFLLLGESLFGETVVFSGRAKQHDILLLLNPPSAQLFVKELDKEDIHDYSLTFDGTNLYYLHDTWKSLEAKAKSSEQDQFAIVQYEPLLQNGGYLLHSLWLPAISQCQPNLVLTNLNFLRPRPLPENSLNIRQIEAEDKLKFEGWGPPNLVLRRNDFSKIFDYSEKFPEGIKAFDLEVSSLDFMGASELNFRYQQYFPEASGKYRRSRSFVVTLIRNQDYRNRKIKPPPVLSKTTILDARFADEMPEGLESFVSYKPKNNQWLPADDAVVQTNFFEVKKAVERKHAARWHGIIFFFLLTALICGPVIAEWFINKRKTNRAKLYVQ